MKNEYDFATAANIDPTAALADEEVSFKDEEDYQDAVDAAAAERGLNSDMDGFVEEGGPDYAFDSDMEAAFEDSVNGGFDMD